MERNPDAMPQNLDAMPGNPDVEDRRRRRRRRRRRSESDRRSREMLGDGRDQVTNSQRNDDLAVME